MNKSANFLLKFFTKKRKNREAFRFSELQNVLLLSDESISKDLIRQYPNVTLLFYSEKRSIPKGFEILDPNDISFFGKIKNEKLQEILDKNYDLFINNLSEESSFLDYIYSHINAKLMVNDKENRWTDLIVEKPNHNSQYYFTNIYKIIQKIN